MSSPGQEFVEVFLQEASEHLQFLREYAGILLDPYPGQDDLERLYVSAHTLKGSSGMYGFPLFSEVAAKLAHIFQYAMNVGISPDAAAPLVEFASEAVAVLESDLWMISSNSGEASEDIAAFKAKYPFAFQQVPEPQSATEPEQYDEVAEPAQPAASLSVDEKTADRAEEPSELFVSSSSAATANEPQDSGSSEMAMQEASVAEGSTAPVVINKFKPEPQAEELPSGAEFATQATAIPEAPPLTLEPVRQGMQEVEPTASAVTDDEPHGGRIEEPEFEWPEEGEVPAEVLEFFVPEVEEHLQTVTECLLSLEANSNAEDIHRLFRSMHTIKGSAAQVGLPRISLVAHRAEDLVGRLRDGALKPGAEIVDLCLESVDTLKKFLYKQWPDDAEAQKATKSLLGRIGKLVPRDEDEIPTGFEAHPTVEAVLMEASALEQSAPVAAEDPITLGSLIEASPEFGVIAPDPLADLVAPDADANAGIAQTAAVAAPSLETHNAEKAASEVSPAEAATTKPQERSAVPAAAAPGRAVLSGEISTVAVSGTVAGPAPSASGSPVAQPGIGEVRASVPAVLVAAVSAVKTAMAVASQAAPEAAAAIASATAASSEIEPLLGLKKDAGSSVPLSRSVRIALERLDRMMNAVGELVINRTRMLGRVAELERLADVLNFSKARMSDKINEFQEKYEFSRITGVNAPEPPRPNAGYYDSGFGAQSFGSPAGMNAGESFPFRGGYSSYAQKFDASLAEFSELEMDRYDEFSILSRSLTEISADITEILTQLDGFVRRVDSDIDEFTKLAHRLQDEITAARMVPIGNLYTRISRTVRDAAKAAGKQVELQLAGAETELDNNIIQQIADPLLHLVRNAVAHGIERAEERYEQGKPDSGNIYVRAYHRGNHIYVEVEDDGRGLDYDNLRSTAVEIGLVTAARAEKLNERDLQNLLFHPGFSTATRKTELAGRGVGLDVVRANISALNGEVEIETQKGFGTRFTLKVPLTLIISQALFVRCGQSVFAFPLAFVEEIRRIRAEQIEEVGGRLLTKVRDSVTEVVCLDRQLGLDVIEPLNGYYRLVIVNVAGRQVGIVVEEVLRKDEIVIKSLGEYLRNVKLFPGATIAPDGSLILLVDVNRLIAGEAIERRPLMTAANAARLFFPGASALASGEVPSEAIDLVAEEKVIVLADDSISVRKFVGRMLEKAGFRVKLACDGLDALEIVGQTRCDLVVTDLEMPRTNGYELMAHLKQNPKTRDIPVMVVTSRAGAKHRDKAIKQGATEFLVKPVQEEQFVAAVERLIGKATEPGGGAQAIAQDLVQGQA